MKKFFLCVFIIIGIIIRPVYVKAHNNEEKSESKLRFEIVDVLTTFQPTSSATGNGHCVIVGKQGRIRVSNIENLKNYKSLFLDECNFIKVFFIDNKFIALSEEGNVYESNYGQEWKKKKIEFHKDAKMNRFYRMKRFQRIIKVYDAFYVNNKLMIYCELEIGDVYRNAILVSRYTSDYKILEEYILDNLSCLTGDIAYDGELYYLIVDQYVDKKKKIAIHKLVASKEIKDFEVIKKFDVRINGMLINEDLYLCYGHGGESYSFDEWGMSSSGNNEKDYSNRVIYYSEDGLNWNETDVTTGQTNGGFMDVVFDGERYIGGGHNILGTSPDGVNWKINNDINIYTCDIETTDNQTILLGKDGDKNCYDWNYKRYIINDFTNGISKNKIEVSQSEKIFKSKNSFILIGDKMGVSNDGLNWNVTEGIKIRDSRYRGIVTSDMGCHIISKYDFLTSENGVDWYNYTDYINKNEIFRKKERYAFKDILTDGSKIYIYGEFWEGVWKNCVWITEDLKKWTFKPLEVKGYSKFQIEDLGFAIEQIRYLNGKFILLSYARKGDFNVIMYSSDGVNYNIVKRYYHIEKEDNKIQKTYPEMIVFDQGYYFLIKEIIDWEGGIGLTECFILEKSKDLISWEEIDLEDMRKGECIVDFNVLNGNMILAGELISDYKIKTFIFESKEEGKWKSNEFENYEYELNIKSNGIFEDRNLKVCMFATKIFFKDSENNWEIANTPGRIYHVSSSEFNGERIYIGLNTALKSKINK